MAKKISELPAAEVPLGGTELVEIVQGGVSKKVASSELGGGGGGGGGGATLPVVQALSSSRSLTLADANTFNVNSTSSAYTATIPAQSSVAWAADTEIHFLRSGTGAITITAAAGVSVNGVTAASVTMAAQHGAVTIKRVGLNAWWLGGLASDSPIYKAITLTDGHIVFPAVQVPSENANTLDDYEEGTFTPVITFATPGDISVTYGTQAGFYTKIGREVFIRFNIFTNAFTHTTASGPVIISGLPFTSLSLPGSGSRGVLGWAGITKASYTDAQLSIASGASVMSVTASGSGQVASTVVAADMPSGGTVSLIGSASYMA